MVPETYPHVHAERTNLLIHIIAVPVFIATFIGVVVALVTGAYLIAALMMAGPPLAMAAQGSGHRRESEAPAPFTGPVNVVQRILIEQFITFPTYVLTGGWWRAWRAATADSSLER